MLFNKRDCCGMMGPEPFMQQQSMMPQDDYDGRECCGMMGQNPFMQPRPMMPQDDFDGRDCCGMMGQNPFMQPRPMMPQNDPDGGLCGCKMEPIVEAPMEKCIKRDICHEIQHVCPIHTKIINNHIYRHTYVPQYTCSEENTVCNIDQGSCCNFM